MPAANACGESSTPCDASTKAPYQNIPAGASIGHTHSQLIVTPWEEHYLMVAALSHPDKMASKVILEFINGTKCASTDGK